MSESNALPPMADGQNGSCLATGFQVVYLEADVEITAAAVPMTPIVTYIGTATVAPLGTQIYPRNTSTCGFTISQSLLVEVPVTFEATATPTATRQFCEPASTTACLPARFEALATPAQSRTFCSPPGTPFFQPKSVEFFVNHMDLTNFTNTEICNAAECVKANSSFLNNLLTQCPPPGAPCPPDLSPCASQITTLLTPDGAVAATLGPCPPGSGQNNNTLGTTLRQLLAVLLDVCLCATTSGGVQVGGVQLNFKVDLSSFNPADLAALGLVGACVKVSDVVVEANTILTTCDRTLAGKIAPILTDMAQETGTIIQPIPCP